MPVFKKAFPNTERIISAEKRFAVRFNDTVWIEDLISLVEQSASSELYSLLKRADEKFVRMRAYENPVFVEDLVRNVVMKLKEMPHITWYSVEAENFEKAFIIIMHMH